MSKAIGDVKIVSDGTPNPHKMFKLEARTNPNPKDGDLWRVDNTNTGLKIRIAGVTKTITVT
jgi:hypothetical protein